MAEFTTNYNLIKPGEEDYYNVQDFNRNMDTLDTELNTTQQEIVGVSTKLDQVDGKIGKTNDKTAETLFGKLNQTYEKVATPIQVVKSLQRVVVSISGSDSSVEYSIRKVNPYRCVVLFERIHVGSDYNYINYSLNADSIKVSHTNSSLSIAGFWIIEFY